MKTFADDKTVIYRLKFVLKSIENIGGMEKMLISSICDLDMYLSICYKQFFVLT